MSDSVEFSAPNRLSITSLIIFWLLWVFATAATTAASRALVTAIQNLVPGDNLPLDVFAIGLCVGFVQWLILRRYLPVSGWWAPATSLWEVAELAIFAFRVPGTFLGGALVGAVQWLVLKRAVDGAEVWIGVTAIAWGAAAFLASTFLSRLNTGYTASYTVFHALIAVITGIGLAWIMLMASDSGLE